MTLLNQTLYPEHLEEASFLYEQRGTLFHDPEVGWRDIGDFEERFEAHIDALVVGGDDALRVCRMQAEKGDFGELHTAVRVFCRHKRLDLIQEVLEKLDTGDQQRVLAVRNALKHEWPKTWNGDLGRILREKPDKAIAVMPSVAGFQRIPAQGALLHVLPLCPRTLLYPHIVSMGRLQARSARTALTRYLTHRDQSVRSAAAVSLLRMGVDPATLLPAYANGSDLPFWQLMSMALSGGSLQAGPLIRRMESPDGSADIAFALGVLGDPRAVDPLIRFLAGQQEPGTVALALNLITGADLYAEVFVPDAIDEDELFEEELETLKKGEPLYPPGGEPGTTLVQLTVDPCEWALWWRQNQARFTPGVRFRNGKPYAPACLLENLRSEKSPVLVRQIANEELVVRYGVDIAFETDMTVNDQLRALERMETAIADAGPFKEGKWYFAGLEIA